MSRFTRRRGWSLPGLALVVAGCGSHYDDPSTSTYIIGGLFLLVGLALGYALIMGRK